MGRLHRAGRRRHVAPVLLLPHQRLRPPALPDQQRCAACRRGVSEGPVAGAGALCPGAKGAALGLGRDPRPHRCARPRDETMAFVLHGHCLHGPTPGLPRQPAGRAHHEQQLAPHRAGVVQQHRRGHRELEPRRRAEPRVSRGPRHSLCCVGTGQLWTPTRTLCSVQCAVCCAGTRLCRGIGFAKGGHAQGEGEMAGRRGWGASHAARPGAHCPRCSAECWRPCAWPWPHPATADRALTVR